MTLEQFRAALKAQPFRPFSIHVADQHAIQIRHPEVALVPEAGRTVYINTGGENVEIVDLLLATRLTFNGHRPPPGSGRRSKRR